MSVTELMKQVPNLCIDTNETRELILKRVSVCMLMMEVLPKRRYVATGLHGVTFHQILRPTLKVVSMRAKIS